MASLRLRGKLIICCILGQLLSPIHALTLQAEEPGTVSIAPAAVAVEATEPKGKEGFASYYATRYNNRRTNSGQRYDPAKLTAAHATLPHGTRVRVINLANKKEVIVTINDRCRPRSGPFIDLSRAAAKQLGFLGKGKTRVSHSGHTVFPDRPDQVSKAANPSRFSSFRPSVSSFSSSGRMGLLFYKIRLPNSDAARSAARRAVRLFLSRIGLISTMSMPQQQPQSAMISIISWASRQLNPPGEGVPTPGPACGSRLSISRVT